MNDLVDLVAPVPGVLERALAVDMSGVSATEALRLNQLVSRIGQLNDALRLRTIAIAQRHDAHRLAGSGSLTALVAEEAGVSRRDASSQVRLARQLESAPLVSQALGRDGMSPTKARLVTEALESLPDDVSDAGRSQIEHALVEAAPNLSVEQFRIKASRAMEHIDVARADQLENQRLQRREKQQARSVSLWMSKADPDTGMVRGGFEIDALTADMLRSVLDSKTSPRARQDLHDWPEYKQVLGEAFVDVLRHMPREAYGNHGGVAATVVVTVDEDSLCGRTDAAGVTEHGTRVSAAQVRQLACNAGIIPAVLGSRSQVLDLGRTARLHNVAQRMALAARDAGCAYPGCDRPPGWCEAHHIEPWSSGGDTTVANGVLLCSFHHRMVHQQKTAIRISPVTGAVEFEQANGWRHNQRYRPGRARLSDDSTHSIGTTQVA